MSQLGTPSAIQTILNMLVNTAPETITSQTIDKINSYQLPFSFRHPHSPKFVNHVTAKQDIISAISFINASCIVEGIDPIDRKKLVDGINCYNFRGRLEDAISLFIEQKEKLLKEYRNQLIIFSKERRLQQLAEAQAELDATNKKNNPLGDEGDEELSDTGLRAFMAKRSKLLDEADVIAEAKIKEFTQDSNMEESNGLVVRRKS